MDAKWPKAVTDFEAFLQQEGLQCQCRQESESFGDRLAQFVDTRIGVQLVSDRGAWSVNCKDAACPSDWYRVGLLQAMLGGTVDEALSLQEQIDFVQTNWSGLLQLFSADLRNDTHARLASLARESAMRRFPQLFPFK